jgi:hypothetical protein
MIICQNLAIAYGVSLKILELSPVEKFQRLRIHTFKKPKLNLFRCFLTGAPDIPCCHQYATIHDNLSKLSHYIWGVPENSGAVTC